MTSKCIGHLNIGGEIMLFIYCITVYPWRKRGALIFLLQCSGFAFMYAGGEGQSFTFNQKEMGSSKDKLGILIILKGFLLLRFFLPNLTNIHNETCIIFLSYLRAALTMEKSFAIKHSEKSDQCPPVG